MKIRDDRPENNNGHRHYLACIEFLLKPARTVELKTRLAEMGLKFQKDCRFSFKAFSHESAIQQGHYESLDFASPAFISFRSQTDMMLFKLAWDECEPPFLAAKMKWILPVIRRVMPTVIANEIIGVSPMTGPSVATLRALYASSLSSTSGPGSETT